VAKCALKSELASLCEPARLVVLFVGDEFNTYCAKVLEGKLGQGDHGLVDKTVTRFRRSTPIGSIIVKAP
jgi:hypothetical protein